MIREAVKGEERLLKVELGLKVTEGFLPGMGGLCSTIQCTVKLCRIG